mmetsp:Transcript_42893/g.130519  ORF Transcript_42893/g.130519 Transcript_42893/m.130519 type:complete len:211 (-) Transcript_42893:2334-2966(-)
MIVTPTAAWCVRAARDWRFGRCRGRIRCCNLTALSSWKRFSPIYHILEPPHSFLQESKVLIVELAPRLVVHHAANARIGLIVDIVRFAVVGIVAHHGGIPRPSSPSDLDPVHPFDGLVLPHDSFPPARETEEAVPAVLVGGEEDVPQGLVPANVEVSVHCVRICNGSLICSLDGVGHVLVQAAVGRYGRSAPERVRVASRVVFLARVIVF